MDTLCHIKIKNSSWKYSCRKSTAAHPSPGDIYNRWRNVFVAVQHNDWCESVSQIAQQRNPWKTHVDLHRDGTYVAVPFSLLKIYFYLFVENLMQYIWSYFFSFSQILHHLPTRTISCSSSLLKTVRSYTAKASTESTLCWPAMLEHRGQPWSVIGKLSHSIEENQCSLSQKLSVSCRFLAGVGSQTLYPQISVMSSPHQRGFFLH